MTSVSDFSTIYKSGFSLEDVSDAMVTVGTLVRTAPSLSHYPVTNIILKTAPSLHLMDGLKLGWLTEAICMYALSSGIIFQQC